jgi:hypothetical protein
MAKGRWLTENGDGAIELYDCADKLCGRLVWMKQPLDKNGQPLTDVRNATPELRTRRLCGLAVLGDLRPQGADRLE